VTLGSVNPTFEHMPSSIRRPQPVADTPFPCRGRSGFASFWVFAGAGFFWLAILFGLTAADYLTRCSTG